MIEANLMMPQENEDLKLSNYDFHLPEELIAQRPVKDRHSCKLLVYKHSNGEIIHTTFNEISKHLPKESTIVFNNSKVIPCRLFGKRPSGGKCELLLLSLDPEELGHKAMIRSSNKKKVGDTFIFDNDLQAQITGVGDSHFFVKFNVENLNEALALSAVMPIPPYIRKGEADEEDREDYQTIYAQHDGSVAAPTAGLHFSEELLAQLDYEGFKKAYVALHVGMGTFAPVKADNLSDHKMHNESYFIERENIDELNAAKKVVAVGTTSLRVLESSVGENRQYSLRPGELSNTEIFLHPGIDIKSVDALITNFHLPKSTLLMLVASLIGRKKTLEIYEEAIKCGYRFYSYGDAMCIIV